MKCPVVNTELQMTERQGVEIDYCPLCRGVWLDRGELDKIIDRANTDTPPSQPQTEYREAPQSYQPRQKQDEYYRDDNYKHKKKRENFLGDLFDF